MNFTLSTISRNEAGKMYDAASLGADTYASVEAAEAAAIALTPPAPHANPDILIYSEVTGETVVGWVKDGKFIEEFRGDYSDAKEILNQVD